MFSKLLKYDWKANSKLLGLLSLCALGAGLLGGGVLRAITYLTENAKNEQMAGFAGISGLSTLMFFIVLSLIAYLFAVTFINVLRFYKSRFTDEGYLTFTLPVTAKQIYLSAFLNMLLWLVISALVLAVAVSSILLIGLPGESWDIIKPIAGIFVTLDGVLDELPGYRLYMVVSTLQSVINPIYVLVLLMTSVTIGAVIAKRHKIWASIGMYFGIQVAVGIVESILAAVPTLMLLFSGLNDGENYLYHLSTGEVLGIVLQLGLCVGGFVLSTSLMKNKLNLP